MIKKILFTIFFLSIFNIFYTKISTAAYLDSENYIVCPVVTAGGGTSVGSSYKIFLVIGQPVIGSPSSTLYQLNLGLYDECNIFALLQRPYFTDFSFTGDLDYFNFFWHARYSILSFDPNRELAVECYLNDWQQCIPFPFVHRPNSGTCTVVNPNYEHGLSPEGNPNNVSCKVYDPKNPFLFKWRNEFFYPIAFELAVTSLTATVGKESSSPLNVKNNGLLTDNYTIWVLPQFNPQSVSVIFGNTTLINVKKGETAESVIKLISLAVETVYINITVISASSGISTSQVITLEGGMASLDEFDFVGIIQIMAIASLFFVFLYLKKE